MLFTTCLHFITYILSTMEKKSFFFPFLEKVLNFHNHFHTAITPSSPFSHSIVAFYCENGHSIVRNFTMTLPIHYIWCVAFLKATFSRLNKGQDKSTFHSQFFPNIFQLSPTWDCEELPTSICISFFFIMVSFSVGFYYLLLLIFLVCSILRQDFSV